MAITSEGPDERFKQIMTASARRMISTGDSPYDEGMRLMGELGQVLGEADFAGAAYEIWGFLTDGIDGPPAYAREQTRDQIEALMRQAASEWLALDPRPDELGQYFDRWRVWPDFSATN
jgi:hypothetical protein